MFYYLLTDLSCADLSFFDKTDREFIDQKHSADMTGYCETFLYEWVPNDSNK